MPLYYNLCVLKEISIDPSIQSIMFWMLSSVPIVWMRSCLGSWTTELCSHITPTTFPFCTPGKRHLHQVPNHTVKMSGAVWIFQASGFCCLVLSYITMCQIISWPDSITHNNSFNGVVGFCWCHQASSRHNQYAEHKHTPYRQWRINDPN